MPLAPKNTHFPRPSIRERRCITSKEMTLPAVLRLALYENPLTQNAGILEHESIFIFEVLTEFSSKTSHRN